MHNMFLYTLYYKFYQYIKNNSFKDINQHIFFRDLHSTNWKIQKYDLIRDKHQHKSLLYYQHIHLDILLYILEYHYIDMFLMCILSHIYLLEDQHYRKMHFDIQIHING